MDLEEIVRDGVDSLETIVEVRKHEYYEQLRPDGSATVLHTLNMLSIIV